MTMSSNEQIEWEQREDAIESNFKWQWRAEEPSVRTSVKRLLQDGKLTELVRAQIIGSPKSLEQRDDGKILGHELVRFGVEQMMVDARRQLIETLENEFGTPSIISDSTAAS